MIINGLAYAEKFLARSKEPRYTLEITFQENVATGTAQAGTTTTITLASSSSAVDDFYNTMVIEITGGTGVGQRRTITDYVGATKVATVATWSTNPDATSTYRIDDLYFLTSHKQADSAIITSAPVIYDVIRDISGTTQQLYPDEARATIGAMSFDVIDKISGLTSKFYTKLADGYGLKGKRVRLYMGFDGLTFDEYEMKWTQIVDNASFDSGSYEINCADVNRSVRKEIFDLKVTNLSASIDASQTLIPVYSVTGFTMVQHGVSYTDAPIATVGYIKVDKEIIRWTSTTNDATLGLCFVSDKRGALNTQAVAHTIDANAAQDRRTKVEEYIYLEMPAPKLAYAILTGTLYGQGASLPSSWNLGISTDYVRLSDFTGIGSDWWNTSDDSKGFIVRFEGLKKQDAKAFLEKEVYLLLGAFSPVYADGSLGLKRMTGVTSGAAYVMRLDAINVVSHGTLQHDMPRVMNNILIEWNWEDSEQRFTRSNLLIDANSISTHGTSKLARLKFRGLHGSRHSYAALTNRFNALRDRYAGPPLRIDVRVMPSLDVLEIGDIQRVQLATVRDYSTGSTLDRAFEAQGIRTNWITGEVSLTLFGSSQAATVITPDSTGAYQSGTATPPLSDAWYSSAGTSLVTYLAANYPANYTDVGGILTITGNVTLPGNATISEAMSYYYAGDIVINTGVIVTVTQNVYLKAKGHITVNGTINGVGQGIAGGATGTVGYIGTPEAGGGIRIFGIAVAGGLTYITGIRSTQALPLLGSAASVSSIDVYTLGGMLSGIPSDLRGSSGGKGEDAKAFLITLATGGNGGAGGAGALIVCRGMSFGANGQLNLSGNAGVLGGSYTYDGGQTIYAGTGAGGAPGACLVLLDGSASNIPDMGLPVIQQYGANTIQGTQLSTATIGATSVNASGEIFPAYSYYLGTGGQDLGQAAYRVQFLPENTAATVDVTQPLPDVANFSAANNSGIIVFKWSQVNDPRLIGYDIRYISQLVTADWDKAAPLTLATRGTSITSAALPPGQWTCMIKAVGNTGTTSYSLNASLATVTVSNSNAIVKQNAQAPDWLGTKTNFVAHWNGRLVPDSQDAASLDTWDTFDKFVPNAYAQCTYEAPEQALGFDSDLRIWSDIDGALGPGETIGSPEFSLYMDEHNTAGSYDGFEAWSLGIRNTRYVKQKVTLDTANGLAYLSKFTPTLDVQLRTESGTATIAAGGTAIIFTSPFHNTPSIKMTVQGGTALIPTAASPSSTGFTAHVFNTGGSDVGGTIFWEASGS